MYLLVEFTRMVHVLNNIIMIAKNYLVILVLDVVVTRYRLKINYTNFGSNQINTRRIKNNVKTGKL